MQRPAPFQGASPLHVLNQFSFLLARHRFDGAFASHGTGSIRLRLDVHQFHRTPRACVTRPASGVMRFEPSFRIRCPAGIKRPV